MADQAPEISLGFTETGEPAVYVDAAPVVSAAALLEKAPHVCEADRAVLCAQAINHLAQERAFTVIEEPGRFADWYRKRYAAEDPDAIPREGGYSLRGAGMPDLDSVAAPAIADGTLVFFAVNRQIGAPYRVSVSLAAPDTPDYDPMPLAAGD